MGATPEIAVLDGLITQRIDAILSQRIEQALQEGYSTATDEMRELGFGFGMGLPNMKRNSDEFSIESEVGKGTRVLARIKLGANG